MFRWGNTRRADAAPLSKLCPCFLTKVGGIEKGNHVGDVDVKELGRTCLVAETLQNHFSA